MPWGSQASGCTWRNCVANQAIEDNHDIARLNTITQGNVQELQNFIELSVILSTGAVLNGSLSELTHTKLSAPVTLDQAAWLQILQTLSQAEGVVGGRNCAAARLGLPRTSVVSKMKRLGIPAAREEFCAWVLERGRTRPKARAVSVSGGCQRSRSSDSTKVGVISKSLEDGLPPRTPTCKIRRGDDCARAGCKVSWCWLDENERRTWFLSETVRHL